MMVFPRTSSASVTLVAVVFFTSKVIGPAPAEAGSAVQPSSVTVTATLVAPAAAAEPSPEDLSSAQAAVSPAARARTAMPRSAACGGVDMVERLLAGRNTRLGQAATVVDCFCGARAGRRRRGHTTYVTIGTAYRIQAMASA